MALLSFSPTDRERDDRGEETDRARLANLRDGRRQFQLRPPLVEVRRSREIHLFYFAPHCFTFKTRLNPALIVVRDSC